jgi:hypothetical protein
VHVIPLRQLADRALLDPRVASDRGEQLHPRPHPPTPSMITSPSVITVKWGQIKPSQPPRRVGRWGQIRPSQREGAAARVGPHQTVRPGPTQAVTPRSDRCRLGPRCADNDPRWLRRRAAGR